MGIASLKLKGYQLLKIDIQMFLMMVKNYRDDKSPLLEDI